MNTLALKKIADLVPLSIYQLLIKRSAIWLNYHTVSDRALNHIRHLYAYKTCEMFETDLIHLKQHYNIISYRQFKESFSAKMKIRPNAISLSFDDGYSECFSTVRPLLLKHMIPCTFFITTDFIDNKDMFYRNKVSLCIEKMKTIENSKLTNVFNTINNSFKQFIHNTTSFAQWIKSLNSAYRDTVDEICTILGIDIKQYLATNKPYLTSDEIKYLVHNGFTIGAHSKQHYMFNLLSYEDMEKEIVDSCKIIMDLTGKKQVPFAFPFSANGVNPRFLENLISKYKFIELFFNTQGLAKNRDFLINRISCDSPLSIIDNKSDIPQLLRNGYYGELMQKVRFVK